MEHIQKAYYLHIDKTLEPVAIQLKWKLKSYINMTRFSGGQLDEFTTMQAANSYLALSLRSWAMI